MTDKVDESVTKRQTRTLVNRHVQKIVRRLGVPADDTHEFLLSELVWNILDHQSQSFVVEDVIRKHFELTWSGLLVLVMPFRLLNR